MKKTLYAIVLSLLLLSGCSRPIIEDNIRELNLGEGVGPEEFTCENIIGREVFYDDISTLEALAQNVEKTWIEVYGDNILKQRPYIIRFDKDNQLWKIEGSPAYLRGSRWLSIRNSR